MRGDLGFVARYLNKKVSFLITRHFLVHLPFTPNMSRSSRPSSDYSAPFSSRPATTTTLMIGFVLAQVQSILDGCDGELARVRFQQTAIGEWLDTIVDDFLNLALVLAIGVALWRRGAPDRRLQGPQGRQRRCRRSTAAPSAT